MIAVPQLWLFSLTEVWLAGRVCRMMELLRPFEPYCTSVEDARFKGAKWSLLHACTRTLAIREPGVKDALKFWSVGAFVDPILSAEFGSHEAVAAAWTRECVIERHQHLLTIQPM